MFVGSDEFMCMEELKQKGWQLILIKKVKFNCDANSKLPNFQKSLIDYDHRVQDIIKLQDHVIEMQQEIISSASFRGGLLSVSEKKCYFV